MESRKLKMERGGSSNSKNQRRVPTSGPEEGTNNGGQRGSKRDPDHYMPIATLMRITHRVLPANAKVADDAKEAIQECVSEFISFITREANERCHSEYRRTITPNDVVSAMAALGFTNYVDPLTIFINKHRTAQENYITPRATPEYYPPRAAVDHPRATPEYLSPRASVEHPRAMPEYLSPRASVEHPRATTEYYPQPPPPPPAMPVGYVPSPLSPSPTVDLPPVTDYFSGYVGGREGPSGDMDFDPFG